MIARLMIGLLAVVLAAGTLSTCSDDSAGGTENCANRIDDDGDGAVDCVDPDCRENELCGSNPELCTDGLDNDLDGAVDCTDSDCAGNPVCTEDCTNGVDDDGNGAIDCNDRECRGIHPDCGEICGDGLDNDDDGDVDCNDSDCFDVIPPCGDTNPDGTICAYGEDEPHVCECADGEDNDGDGQVDSNDLHCFGPFDDDEESYATGIPGDNMGSHADKECPFDGNSGPGNDGVCCNLDNPEQNVTPNGCDNLGCCEIDVNGNGTGEYVYVRDDCVFAPDCGQEGQHGCACSADSDCDSGQFCVPDNDSGDGFCSTCQPCEPNLQCTNTCECGELCYGGFSQPEEECGGGGPDPVCPTGVSECPNGDADCDSAAGEGCISGCCYASCPEGLIACQSSADCPQDPLHYCITGCCIEMPL